MEQPAKYETALIFPRSLVDRADEFDRLMHEIARAIEAGGDPAAALDAHGLTENERAVMRRTLATMDRLRLAGRNHIWAYYTRNLVPPSHSDAEPRGRHRRQPAMAQLSRDSQHPPLRIGAPE